jgi:hypothetical protein
MSNKTLRIFISLACLIFYTCDNEENPEQSYKIGPESHDSIIQMENENIEFIFCLLNENSEPSTMFKAGENFSFYFSATNKRGEQLCFDSRLINNNESEFLKVYNSGGEYLGKPYAFIRQLDVSTCSWPWEPDSSIVFKATWIDAPKHIEWAFGLCESKNNPPLPKGNYNTQFSYAFRIIRLGNDDFYLDTLTFRINFTIY